MNTQAIELEVVNPDEKLVKYADQTGLEKPAAASLADAFKPVFAKARSAIEDARGVAESVKDATCVKEIKKSRACRLALRAVRLESEGIRKKQKEHALLYGRAVDGFHNILLADLSPVETALQDAEDIAERAEAARLAELKATREKELQPFLEAPILGDLSTLSESSYAKMLSDAKLLKQAKIDAAAKAEADARAKAEADQVERERIAAENARLKAEAEAREAATKAEREESARKLAAERAEAEAKAKAAREESERKLAAERAAADKAAKEAAEKARKEREAIEEKARTEREAAEAKAKAERAAAEAAAKKERDRLQAIADEERKKLAAAEAAAKALREAEAKKQAEAAAAAKKAAAAPDNAKAQAFADLLREMPLPQFSGDTWAQLPNKIEALAKWVESQISTGELL